MRSSQRVMVVCVLAVLAFAAAAAAQDAAIVQKLDGFDAYMQKILKDWNAPAARRRSFATGSGATWRNGRRWSTKRRSASPGDPGELTRPVL